LEDQKEEMSLRVTQRLAFLLVAKGSCCTGNVGDGVGALGSWRRRMRVRMTRTEEDTAKEEGG
jgi:hypothetical protein